ncbi:hypothetical protein RCM09_03665 [Escherichia marmotae]|nr:hypothetical protein [Escherichia marmotae]MEC9652023.1 hypothetical protein [Escherichia marmotae]MED0056459.1 hypothetical protein [Escherichia marmotae]MED0114131.1 hypothetical protein [Escherichia marmotae]MED0120297.1 hypothetical protein [Escherichia marmotae]MED8699201.1 hypothetical protein [Escherichia marmotae]
MSSGNECPEKMLVLVPEGLKRLNVLRNVCLVCSGGENLQQLSIDINAILTSGPVQTDRFSLTQAQRWALKHFSEGSGGKDRPLNQYQSKLYRQYARLADKYAKKVVADVIIFTGLFMIALAALV